MERQSTMPMSDRRQNGSPAEGPDISAAPLFLETLGAAELSSVGAAGRRTTLFGPSKPLALIVYLASVPGRSATREFLVDLLWADLDGEAARHAFRQTLWYIKQKTGRALIRSSREGVSLAEPIPSDRAEFLRAAEDREFELAVTVYRGEFLPAFAAPGGLQFEQWADLERQRLRDIFSRAAEHEVRRFLTSARPREAAALARRSRDVDPLNEKGWRLLLESLVSANDSLGASVEADALEQMLAGEGRPPEPATRAMLRTARQVSAEPSAVGGAAATIVAELVGREAEFASLLGAWDQVKSGGSRKMFVVGAAGIGKTRLLADLVARLRGTRGRVVVVRANPGEREIAYALLSKLAGALGELPGAAAVPPACAATLVAINPALSSAFSNAEPDRSTGADALRRRTIAVHQLAAAAADEAPVAVIVDDLHWADRESAQAIGGLSELLDRERVLLVAAARPSSAAAAQSVRNAGTIRLAPLTIADTGALLASVARLPEGVVGRELPALLRRASDGVPLLAIETLQFLLDQELLRLEEDGWVVPDERKLVRVLNAGGALRRRIESLDDSEQGVLTVMALAGVPVPMGFIGDVVGRAIAEVAAILHSLETRGMVSHTESGWTPVHDQIGEMALDGLDRTALAGMERKVAEAWLHGGRDDHAMRRAGAHFLRAGDETAVVRTFVAWARGRRRGGDRRSGEELAGEFVDTADDRLVRRLERSLPYRYRYSAGRWRAAATIVFVAAASAATTWQWAHQTPAPPDDQFLAVVVDSGHDTTVYRVGIRRDRWTTGDLIDVPSVGHRIRTALPSSFDDYTVAPDGKSWISWVATADSGGDDIMLEPMTGGRRRITWARGDDRDADVSPDGRRMVFRTGRYDSLSHSHLAIMDLATRRTRQLTVGDGVDVAPVWGPSGLLIAFARLTYSDGQDSVCVIAPDGSGRRCVAWSANPSVVGWIDHGRLLVSSTPDSNTVLEVFDLRSRTHRVVQREGAAVYKLSPDGRWVACICRDIGASAHQSVVFPIDHPDLARPVVAGALDARLIPVLWPSRPPPRYVAKLRLELPEAGIPMGSAYRISVTGTTVDGRAIVADGIRVVSADTSIVQVARNRRLIPVRPGRTRLTVSAGGWRVDTAVVRVVPHRDSTILSTDWSQGIPPAFVPFGVPAPSIVTDGTGHPAFWTGGDGNYESGVLSRATFSAAAGLGMETTVSMPIDMIQWQAETIGVRPVADSAGLANWDHRTGYPPLGEASLQGACMLIYPAGEGERSVHRLRVGNDTFDPATLFGRPLSDGHWFRVRDSGLSRWAVRRCDRRASRRNRRPGQAGAGSVCSRDRRAVIPDADIEWTGGGVDGGEGWGGLGGGRYDPGRRFGHSAHEQGEAEIGAALTSA